ncbi:MAG: hypothetical protein LUC24_00455 [Bacteroidales bacterium]|nr:hypothetical protein [Bacteroidales bacterium]
MSKKSIWSGLGLLAVSCLLLASCDTGGDTLDETSAPVLTLTTAAVTASSSGGSYSFTYSVEDKANDGSVICSSDASWIVNVDYSSFGTVSFSLTENSSEQVRSSYVTVMYSSSNGSASEKVLVAQNAVNEPSLSVSEASVIADVEGGDYSFTYTVDDPLGNGNLTCSTDSLWISDIDYTSVEGTVSFKVSENERAELREGEITLVYSNSNGTVSLAVGIVQQAAVLPIINVSPRKASAPYSGGSYSFTYTVTNPAEDGIMSCYAGESWITNAYASGGTVTFDVDAYDQYDSRSAVLTLTYSYKSGKRSVSASFAVSQVGLPSLSVSSSCIVLKKAAQTGFSFEVVNPVDDGHASCCLESDCDWISDVVCSDDGTVSFSVTENNTGDWRSAKLTLTYTYSETSTSETVTVAQKYDSIVLSSLIGTYTATGIALYDDDTGSVEEMSWTLEIKEKDETSVYIDGLCPALEGFFDYITDLENEEEAWKYLPTAYLNDDEQLVVPSQVLEGMLDAGSFYIGFTPCVRYSSTSGSFYYDSENFPDLTFTYNVITGTWESDNGILLGAFTTRDLTSFRAIYDAVIPTYSFSAKTDSAASSVRTSGGERSLRQHDNFQSVQE